MTLHDHASPANLDLIERAADMCGYADGDELIQCCMEDEMSIAICTERGCDSYEEEVECDYEDECPECGGTRKSVMVLANLV